MLCYHQSRFKGKGKFMGANLQANYEIKSTNILVKQAATVTTMWSTWQKDARLFLLAFSQKKKKSLFVQSNNFKHGCVLRLELGFITFTLKYPRIFNLILPFRTPTISRLVTKSMDYIFFSNRRKQLYMNFILSKNKWSLNK